tara:strand:+ start:2425 stop:3615 length:1191 start_codon:yes stop_codon:yes gene_type:complete
MSKPSIQNITTTQTFQNWFDKTNEMVDIMRDSALTASVSGDTTIGDATLVGEFTGNTVIVFDELQTDTIVSRSPGDPVVFGNRIHVTAVATPLSAIFEYGASGAKTRYTDNVTAWDIGYDNTTNSNFQMNFGAGGQFSLSPAGVLTVPSLITSADVELGTDLTILGNLTANTATFVAASGAFSGTFSGNFTGDVYHPNAAGGNGTGKVLENGGPAANIPATFWGNVNGTVSSLTNHNTDSLAEKALNPVNLWFTNTRARNALAQGTGVTYTAATGTIAIGQAVATTSDVVFKTVTATGEITAFGSVSDIRQKENIKPIENALDKVSKLGGYTFNYKHDKDTPMTGVMAQELLEVLPEAVYKTIDANTGEEIYAVRHGNVIGLLIEAIKELNEKVGK